MNFLNWHAIHTVFLDMDGTLLDLHFDNQFWLHHLPKRYAEKNQLSWEVAKATVMERYQEKAGTLQWYCVDYWSNEFDMDIALLKEELVHLINVHPHVKEFLLTLQQHQKRTVLVTNAHQKSLALKMQRTQLAQYFNRIVCAHDLGLPKEVPEFWERLQRLEPFNRMQTLLIDDSVSVLRSAASYGISHLLGIRQPDSQLPPKDISEFKAITHFQELIPNII